MLLFYYQTEKTDAIFYFNSRQN